MDAKNDLKNYVQEDAIDDAKVDEIVDAKSECNRGCKRW